MASGMNPPVFNTPEAIAANSQMNDNANSSVHPVPPAIDPKTSTTNTQSKSAHQAAAESSIGGNESMAVHPHAPIGSNTASDTTYLSRNDDSSIQQPNQVVHPGVGLPPSLKTPSGLSQETSDQWAAHALNAMSPSPTSQQQPQTQSNNVSTGVDMNYVKEVADTVVETAKDLAAATVPIVKGTIPAAKGAGETTVDRASGAAQYTREAAGNVAGGVSNTASNAAGTVGNATSNFAGSVSNTASNATGAVTNTASNAAGTASSTVGSMGTTMMDYAASAGDAVKPYLPTAVAGVLPSHPRTGPAPGLENLSGTSVAQLPEERRTAGFPSHDDESMTPLGKAGGVGSLPGDSKESGVALPPDERHDTRATPFHKEAAPFTGGVPGDNSGERHQRESFLNPNFTVQPILGEGEAAPVGLPQRNVPEVSTHVPLAPSFDDRHQTFRDKEKDRATYGAPIGPDSAHALAAGTPTHIPEGKMHDKTYLAPVGPSVPKDGTSTNASIKTLPGSKRMSQEDWTETLREHGTTSDAMPCVVPMNDSKNPPRTHLGATLAQINSKRNEQGKEMIQGSAPAPPPKDATKIHVAASKGRTDSDRATAGHGASPTAPVTTTTNTLGHAPAQGGIASPNADKATSYPSGTKHVSDGTSAAAPSGAGGAAGLPGLDTSMGHGAQKGHYNTTSSTLDDQSSPTTSTGSGGRKKPGFMSKVKGEVKVLSGKFGHNEAKVEEGRRMMGKN